MKGHPGCRRGSDKALKYLKNRFTQKNVKVQNSSLIVSITPTLHAAYCLRFLDTPCSL